MNMKLSNVFFETRLNARGWEGMSGNFMRNFIPQFASNPHLAPGNKLWLSYKRLPSEY